MPPSPVSTAPGMWVTGYVARVFSVMESSSQWIARVMGSTTTFSRTEPKRMAWKICGSARAERRMTLA